ncbi:hypothetical protein Fleli_2811 [Bernardetia litoralis DSM 6794]|uniref:Uncharacterized protein n=1 Tax=Bernardetia litoralis (strain ATCC 23117 / DSM 6794 / NBRC 15988 / NCIMB 1366 / Fx l1 / Sio-4) TaxID=880071 RepID=I4AMH9_BERLS|nr:hypothetical protein [Bernardetia litoralis]AFM05164.1 hypothetical protein Fleli_2811 [Bernardetia litoralis DSM 6794]
MIKRITLPHPVLRNKLLLSSIFLFSFLSIFTDSQAQFNFKKDSTSRVTINKGSHYTRTPFVTLQIAAFDIKEMQISNRQDFIDAHWIAYQPTVYGWKLIPEDGDQKVYVRFKDVKANMMTMATADIHLDMTPPKNPKIKIDVEGEAIKDSTQLVKLFVSAEEAQKRYYVMVSNHRSFYRQRWQLVTPEIEDWQLGSKLDGVKIVFAKFRDRSGNISEVVSDKVILDTQGPVRPSITINNGQPALTKQAAEVQLTLTAGGATEMIISDTDNFEGKEWQPIKKYLKWTLSEGDGEKRLYARFRDNAKNETEIVSASIDIDSTPPSDMMITVNGGDQTSRHINGVVELVIKAKDAKYMMISNNENFRGGRWLPYQELVTDWHLVGENGKKSVFIKFKDDAGNQSEAISDEIVLIR